MLPAAKGRRRWPEELKELIVAEVLFAGLDWRRVRALSVRPPTDA